MPIHTHARARAHLRLASCSFYLPVACGFILAGGVFAETGTLKAAEDICVLMGEYFQVQDDYLDAYAPPEVLGKIGTDIQDNKCSWLVVQAMSRASPQQLATLKANYGQHDAAAVAVVKALYAELGLEAVFQAYEQVRTRGRADAARARARGCCARALLLLHGRRRHPNPDPLVVSPARRPQESYEQLKRMISDTCAKTNGTVPEEVYLSLLHKIYKRQK